MRLLLEQTKRMLAETREMDMLAADASWLTKLSWGFTANKEVCVDFDITVAGKVHEAVLVYPDLFPQAPAYVRPRKVDEAWSSHQFPGTGTLCLEWGPDTWHPGVTGADLIRSTHKLLAFEKLGPALGLEAPSRHEPTLGQRLRSETRRFLVTPELALAMPGSHSAPFTPLTVSTSTRFRELVSIAVKLGPEDGNLLPALPPEVTDAAIGSVFLRSGWLVRCDEWSGLAAPAKSQADIRDYLKVKGRWPWPDDEDRSAFLLLVDDQRALRPIALAKGTGDTAYEYRMVDFSVAGTSRQPETNQCLAGKRVAVIGLGSVGSKLAVTLARSGVTRFLLIDDDILAPGNLSRNQLDWQSVGYDKVDGTRGAIRLVRPDAEVQTRTFRFAGQESSAYNTTVLEQVAACDLVIDATASPKVFSSVAAICARRGVPLVWGEVFAGGIGALMARSIPGQDADPLTVRAAINAYLATLPEAPFKHAEGYDAEEAGMVYVAGDAEVSQLAASLAQFAIDALVTTEARRFPVAAYLLGYQKAWVFEAPFDTRAIECPTATPGPADPEDAEANATAFGELISVFSPSK
ncbi:ThiF family adenylyltransferase [Leptothrix discophora]|uniref:ThiF family adenylyltransferase n=1 Tax=Leptothrix discophora TaxID=89 RepID=A0ABT9G2N2_LEPDI|nr:ThiF family adenylyltransferase [Leptothrix discophora]MDP4300740.1 ThiF family adenylyltransferase [Leptothrix discophora]